MRTVLIIDDNPAVGEALSLLLSLHDIRPLVALNQAEGLAALERGRVDAVIQDMNFTADTTSGEEGVELFRAIREQHPDLPVILLTAWTHLETAVELVKAGAADYLAKPWDDHKLLTTVENLLELSESTREVSRARRERRRRREVLQNTYDLDGLVFASEAMARTLELACQVARAEVPILITGPNGAGKERIAAIVHANSLVKKGPFVAVNCGALPGELIEAELFGADAGAYTGANKAREGRFELADGGTLFLDEIGEMDLALQAKLLRFLQSGTVQRVGDTTARKVDVRIISATNRDPFAEIATGRFREDLFYRLHVLPIHMPPLRARADDVLLLAETFLARFTAEEQRDFQGFSAEAAAMLLAHAWPGNVRELQNAIRRMVVLNQGTEITAQMLPATIGAAVPPMSDTLSAPMLSGSIMPFWEQERSIIESAVGAFSGNIARAAAALEISPSTIYRKRQAWLEKRSA